jgi:cobalt-zinc-cadmium resistance protein CzcA
MIRKLLLVALLTCVAVVLTACSENATARSVQPKQPDLVKTTAAELQSVTDVLEIPATVQADPAMVVRVYPPAGGRLLQVRVRPGDHVLDFAQKRSVIVVAAFAILVIGTIALSPLLGGEFMPKLEEGNIWVRITLPQDVSFESAAKLADQVRDTLRQFPLVTHVVSHEGRPDDGTDSASFNNLEFFVQLKPQDQWPWGMTKDNLIAQMKDVLDKYPGADTNFSQNIQDNVEEAMSGVKGENSLKLFGDDFAVLTEKAKKIAVVMSSIKGVDDLGVFNVSGQPNLLISVNRDAAARYGLMAGDLNAAVQAAIGGVAATQILQGDRRFDMVLRYQKPFREDPEAIKNILLPTPDGGRVPLGQVADVTLQNGAFMIYRENDRRYIPIKFSVRGRDLSSTMEELQDRLQQVRLPKGYHYEWAGEFDSLKKEQRRLEVVLPITLGVIFLLLYLAFDSIHDAFIIVATLPAALSGGVLMLLITGTPFSISAAVGFASALGVATLGGLVFLSSIRRLQHHGLSLAHSIRDGAMEEMRPVMMACLAAGLGLLPAAVSHGIGAQAQQPLARVVVGAMITTTPSILLLVPALVELATHAGTPKIDSPTPEYEFSAPQKGVPHMQPDLPINGDRLRNRRPGLYHNCTARMLAFYRSLLVELFCKLVGRR